MSLAHRFAIAITVVFAASAQLAAQNTAAVPTTVDQSASVVVSTPAPAVAADAVQSEPLGPVANGSTVGVRMLAPSAPAPFVPRREHESHSVIMMIVGGAVLVVGAVIGGQAGTIIMIGGGVVGIIGLIRYLQ
jgi:hypothetical protein